MDEVNITMVIFSMEVNEKAYEYGLSVSQVHEITRPENTVKLPGMPEFVDGIMNLRGNVIPVIDCKKRFGLGNTQIKDTTRNIVVNIDELKYGIIVDNVVEIISIPAERIDDAPSIAGGVNSEFITGIGKVDERLIITLDACKILSKNEEKELISVS